MSNVSNGRSIMAQGRIVWTSGDLFKGKVKTEFGTQIPKKNALNETMMEYGFGLAIPKSVLGQPQPGQTEDIWMAIHAEARMLFPSGQIPPAFAMKYKDGDGIDDQGRAFNLREGHAGHLIFACTTSLPIKYFKWENGANVMINEGIKCGDYVNVQLNIKAHAAIGAGKAGLYMNPNAVQFLGYGKEIINTPSGDQIFGAGMPPLPAGASVTPVAPHPGMLVPSAPPAGGPPMPPGMPMAAPTGPPPPHYGVVPPAFQPPPGGQPMPGPAPVYQQPMNQPPQYPQQGMPGLPPVPGR